MTKIVVILFNILLDRKVLPGIAYKNDQALDLSDAKRLVFFAKGTQGGEKLQFLVAGKDSTQTNENSNGLGIQGRNNNPVLPSTQNEVQQPAATTDPSGLFKNQEFQLTTRDVTLEKEWRRYQVSLDNVDLKGVTHPFGFVLTKGQSPQSVAFSLDGVTYDKNPATDALDVVNGTNNQTSVSALNNATSNVVEAENNNGTDFTEPLNLPESNIKNGTTNRNTTSFNDQVSNDKNNIFFGGDINKTQPVPTNSTTRGDQFLTNNITSSSSLSEPPVSQKSAILEANTTSNSELPDYIINNTSGITTNDGVNDSTVNPANNTNPQASSSEIQFGSTENQVHRNIGQGVNDSITSGDTDVNSSLNELGQSVDSNAAQRYLPDDSKTTDQPIISESVRPFATIMPPFTINQQDNHSASDPASLDVSVTNSATSGYNELLGKANGAPSEDIASTSEIGTVAIPQTVAPGQFVFLPPPSIDQHQYLEGSGQEAPHAIPYQIQDMFAPASASTLTVPLNTLDTTAPETTIVSAADASTGLIIKDGDTSSPSSIIIFKLAGSDDIGLAGYLCSIDGMPAQYCSDSVIFDSSLQSPSSDNVSGTTTHTLEVSAIDTSGNIDSTKAELSWITENAASSGQTISPSTSESLPLPATTTTTTTG